MDELIKALARAATAVAVYYECHTDWGAAPAAPAAPEAPAASEKARKPRKPRAMVPAGEPVSMPATPDDGDPASLLGAAAQPAAPAAASKPAGMTEAESQKAAEDACSRITVAFPQIREGRPEGFYKAKDLLATKFGGSAFKNLTHEQRIQFAAGIADIIAAKGK